MNYPALADEPVGIKRVSDFLTWYATRSPESEALVLDDQRVTYGALQRRVDAVARALLAAGVRTGERVATLATPHPDYFVYFLASVSIGAIWVGLNPRYRTEELTYVVGDCAPTMLVTRTQIGERDYLAEIAAMRSVAPPTLRVVSLDSAIPEHHIESCASFELSGENITDETLAAARMGGGREACLIVYTSGSTGKPKGAVLHHEGIVQACLQQNRIWPVPQQRVVNFLPINHVGCVVDLSCPTLAAGGCIIFMERFDAAESMALTARERVSLWITLPTVFQMQLAVPGFDCIDLTHLQLVIWEGAAMPRPMIQRLLELSPGGLATNYGMTESTTAMTAVPPTDDLDVLADSVGEPFAGVEIRLADEAGHEVAQGEPGEVQTRSIYNMLGYWNRPQETAAVLLPDGWMRTGDIAVKRADGRYRLVGRLKEMFKSGGYNVYPREIESTLETHPAVDLAVVVSRPDPLWQEVGVAYIIPRAPVTAVELEQHCRARLANYKIPKTFVVRTELPRLPIGKVDKAALRREAAGIRDAQFNQDPV